MTLFIQKGNIKIIWDVITMCPLFNELFTTETSQRDWFNQMIGRVYNNVNKNITIDELGDVNRKTIKIMMANLKEQYLKINTDIESRDKPFEIGSENDTPFKRRQSEYDAMKSVYVPSQIDFRSVEIDVPITNLSELVEKHLNERNIQSLDGTEKQTEYKNISLPPVETFGSIDHSLKQNGLKHVSWTTPIETQYSASNATMDNISNEVGKVLQKTLYNINRKIDIIYQNINLIIKPSVGLTKQRTRSNTI